MRLQAVRYIFVIVQARTSVHRILKETLRVTWALRCVPVIPIRSPLIHASFFRIHATTGGTALGSAVQSRLKIAPQPCNRQNSLKMRPEAAEPSSRHITVR